MNNIVYSQITSQPQKLTMVSNAPQIFIPLAPVEGLGKDKLVLPTPQQIPYSQITSKPQILEKKDNSLQGIIPPEHQTRQIHIPEVLLASVSY